MNWLLSTALGMAIFWNADTWKRFVVGTAVVSLVMAWPIQKIIDMALEAQREYRELHANAERARQEWFQRMKEGNCKVTSYVGTKYTIRAVWTCPDGTAHLQLYESEK